MAEISDIEKLDLDESNILLIKIPNTTPDYNRERLRTDVKEALEGVPVTAFVVPDNYDYSMLKDEISKKNTEFSREIKELKKENEKLRETLEWLKEYFKK